MKIKYKILLGAVSVSLLLTACTNSKTEETSNPDINKVQIEEKSEKTPSASNEEQANNEGIKERPNVFGRVKSIIGNEVVIELAEMPERKYGQAGQNPNGERPANPSGEAGNGQGARQRELMLTGETETVLIPVGIPVTTFSRDGEKQIDIGDIYEGSLIQIWYDENDKESKTITKVRIMQGR